ncbi:hypothetical protein EDB84DRAFT_1445726 [Lactarius hengduanensis]|nr:hypothetical protein EDB84DRAFT_1445726 [Lactarius hengduanensis]
MDSTNFAFTETELKDAGLLGEGESFDVSDVAAQALKTMRSRPDLLSESLNSFPRLYHTYHLPFRTFHFHFVVHRLRGPQNKGSPTLSTGSAMSSVLTFRQRYHRCLRAHPHRVREDYILQRQHRDATTRNSFTGRILLHYTLPQARRQIRPYPYQVSLHGVYDTPLNGVWETVGPEIVDLITAWKINWSSVDPARFFTHATLGEKEKGSLGPVVIWVGVIPGSTSSDTAHEVSQEILALLRKRGVKMLSWNGVRPSCRGWQVHPLCAMSAAPIPPTMSVGFLTALLGIPLAIQGMEADDAQGTLTLWFHENNDRKAISAQRFSELALPRPSQEHHPSTTSTKVAHPRTSFELLEAMEQDEEVVGEIRANRRNLDDENEAIRQLEALSTATLAYVQHAEAIKVDVEGGTRYTSDWAAFLGSEAKVKACFEGNVVDLEIFGHVLSSGGGKTTFKFPAGRKLRIVGCATKEDLANPTEFDSEGERCLIVGKDGNTTDLTVGRYVGLVSFTNNVGIVSAELGIYNSGLENAEVFSAKGDSGSLVWHMKDGKAYIVGQLHSGENKGGSDP